MAYSGQVYLLFLSKESPQPACHKNKMTQAEVASFLKRNKQQRFTADEIRDLCFQGHKSIFVSLRRLRKKCSGCRAEFEGKSGPCLFCGMENVVDGVHWMRARTRNNMNKWTTFYWWEDA